MEHEICARRQSGLAPFAVRCDDGVRHEYPQQHPAHRTFFQQDRDRVLHSEAFRRLGYKTQVFVVHEGDFYRTRLTHSLEVAQISRSIACALGVDEDLCEAVAYAHDLGHPPFGHRGEEALDQLFGEALESRFGVKRPEGGRAFEQNFQSYRIVSKLEKRYTAFSGLNLSLPTLDAILRHETAFDHPAIPYPLEISDPKEAERVQKSYFCAKAPSIEAQIVIAADQIAWVTHDLEDALRVRFLTVDELRDLPNALLEQARGRSSSETWRNDRILWGRVVVRNMIDVLISDIVAHSAAALQRVKTPAMAREQSRLLVAFSEPIEESVQQMRQFLYDRVYTHPIAERMSAKAALILGRLFNTLTDDISSESSRSLRLLPRSTQERVQAESHPVAKLQVVVNFIAGMTDRFASEFYRVLYEPEERSITSLY
jgi:dGTPase